MATVRRIVREKAFQTLYLMENRSNVSQSEALEQTFNVSMETDELSEDEMIQSILRLNDQKSNEQTGWDALEYLKTLINGVIENKETLDANISNNLNKWSIGRIEKAALIILRISSYELLYEELDSSIVINEAVELARTFNDDKSAKFINGVLQGILDNKLAEQ